MSFLKQTVKGLGWLGSLRIFSRLFTLLKTAILARLLMPAEFGVFGVVILVMAFFEITTETGINAFLIQEDEEIEPFLNSAWSLSILRGIIIAFFMVIFASPLAHFFGSPTAVKFLLLASLIPLIRGLINPAVIKFRKELEFKKEFNFRLTLTLSEDLLAIILTLITRSVVGLIIALIFSAILEVILSFIFCQPRPHLTWEKEKTSRIIRRGRWVTLDGLFSYLVDQGDDAVAGRLLGMAPLGFYQMAYKISNLPFTEIAGVFSQVTFPVYSKMAGDKKRVAAAFKKTLLATAIFSLPLAGLSFFFPETIIRIILGPAWLPAANALRILALFGISRAIGGSALPILYAFKRQDLAAWISLAKLVMLALLVWPLTLKFGISGTALAVLISSLAIQPFIWRAVMKILR